MEPFKRMDNPMAKSCKTAKQCEYKWITMAHFKVDDSRVAVIKSGENIVWITTEIGWKCWLDHSSTNTFIQTSNREKLGINNVKSFLIDQSWSKERVILLTHLIFTSLKDIHSWSSSTVASPPLVWILWHRRVQIL